MNDDGYQFAVYWPDGAAAGQAAAMFEAIGRLEA